MRIGFVCTPKGQRRKTRVKCSFALRPGSFNFARRPSPVVLLWVLWLAGCGHEIPSQTVLQQVDFLITAETVITMDADFAVFQPGFVAVKGETIEAVGPLAEATDHEPR